MERSLTLTDAMCTELYHLKLVGHRNLIITLIYIQAQGLMVWIATKRQVTFLFNSNGIQNKESKKCENA